MRNLVSHSKMLGIVFKGFRPQTLTKKGLTEFLFRPVNINNDKIYEMFCDWWRAQNWDLVNELSEIRESGWESISNRWAASKISLAIFLSDLEDKDILLDEFSKLNTKVFSKVRKDTALGSDTIKTPKPKELVKLNNKIDKLEKRITDIEEKNKNYIELIKNLQSELNIERSNHKEKIFSYDKLTNLYKKLIEKVKHLDETNHELVRKVKLMKNETESRLVEFKVAQIEYMELGSNVSERKRSISLFYDLLCSIEGMIVEIENRPAKWLNNSRITHFWRREGDRVHILCQPADYIIINLGMLLEDFLDDKGC